MRKLLSLLLLISGFTFAQQPGTLLSPKAINGYTTNGKVLVTKTDGTITGVPTWTVPSLTVIGGTLTGNVITGTLTIPSATTTPQTLAEVLSTGNSVGGQDITSTDGNAYLQLTSGSSLNLANDNGTIGMTNGAISLQHTTLIDLSATSVKKNGSEVATLADIPGSQTLSISGQSLSISGGNTITIPIGGTTSVASGSNITVSGSAPDYTVSVSTSPTFTNSTHTSTTTLTGQIRQAKATAAASSATVDLSTLAGNYAHITGTTTIVNWGTAQAGTEFTTVFDGSLAITSNSVSMILPGNSSIQTQLNDVAVWRSEGSGNWRMVYYSRADEGYTSYVPTFTGFSVNPTLSDPMDARYKFISKNVYHLIVMMNNGTSNATSFTMTLPFISSGDGAAAQITNLCSATNGGSFGSGALSCTRNSNIATCVLNGAAVWTNSGAKGMKVDVFIQTNL